MYDYDGHVPDSLLFRRNARLSVPELHGNHMYGHNLHPHTARLESPHVSKRENSKDKIQSPKNEKIARKEIVLEDLVK